MKENSKNVLLYDSDAYSPQVQKNEYLELNISIVIGMDNNELNSIFDKINKSNFLRKLNIEIWSINKQLLELLSQNLIVCSSNPNLNHIAISLESAKSLDGENLKKFEQLFIGNNKLKSFHIYGMKNEEIKDTEIIKSLFTKFNYNAIEELVIDKNAIGIEGMECLSNAISKYSRLKIFEFNNVMANDSASLKILGQGLSNCQELSKFKFYCNKDMDPVYMSEMLSGLLDCRKLSSISILNINQLEKFTLPLSQILNNNAKTLSFLQLESYSNTKVDDDQIKLLSEPISQCHSLNTLILRQFDIDVLGMSYIKNALSKIDPVYIYNNSKNQDSDIKKLFGNKQAENHLSFKEDWSWCINVQANKGVQWWNRKKENAIDSASDGQPLRKIDSDQFLFEIVINDSKENDFKKVIGEIQLDS